MMFSLVAIPLIAATGSAIDYSIAYERRMVVQDALDAAALAANRLIGLRSDAEIRAEAEAFFLANVAGRVDPAPGFNMVIDGGSVRLTTDLAVPTAFLGLIGINEITFGIVSVSTAGAATYEVVLVLDNSGSMQGTKLSTLKTAARDLVNALFALSVSNPQPDPVRIGLVPFAASVNVGPGYRTAAWMDRLGNAPISRLNFQTTTDNGNTTPYVNTFALYDAMPNVNWLGCVAAREYPYQVTDETPNAAAPATLFTPMFAPDEPNNGNYPNNYLADTGGTCVNAGVVWVNNCQGLTGQARALCNANGGHFTTQNYTFTDQQLQERTCKYQGVWLSSSYRGPGTGPNLHCTASALTPLTNNQTQLLASINAMQASGNTNIGEGVAWGWRVLSPTEPFTNGRAYNVPGNHKIMIVMTDGANTYNSNSNMNRSDYAAYNYIRWNLLGTTSSNNTNVINAMNARTLETCANARAEGITIYTIAFQVQDASARQILNQCASEQRMAFESNNNAELIAAFQLIAQDITRLRLAQ